MTDFLETIHVAVPEGVLLVTACLALLGDLFLKKYYKSIALAISLVGLIVAGFISYLLLGQFTTIVFHGLFVSDDSALLMKIFMYLSVFLCFVYSDDYLKERQMPDGDFYVLGLFSTIGMSILVSAHSMLTIYLGLELLSLPLYAMTAIRKTDGRSSEAAMKYFVMGAIASGMLLYGISLVYAATGAIDLQEISNMVGAVWHNQRSLLAFATIFIIAGVGFKLASVPFHMWAPDVYQGAPTSVTLFLSTAPKIAAVGMAFRLLTLGFADLSSMWQQILLVMALLSVGLGNVLAIVQTNLKRLLAYSAIAHIGFVLFGILADTAQGFSASLYYILVYSLMSAASFGLLVLLSKGGIEIENIDDLKGLNKRSPWLALMMLIVMFSMAGVPPTVGFFTKLLVLKALVDVNMTWVAVVGLIFAVVGAFYYLRVIKVMYFDEPESDAEISLGGVSQVLFSLNSLSLLYLGIFPGGLIAEAIAAFAK